jgi:hypothetical protein
VLLYRFASFWLVALAGWLIVFWLRRPRAHRRLGPSRRTAYEQDTAMAADLPTTDTPAGLGAHELVLLHGQPARPPTGSWSPDGCPPRSTPSQLTGRATAPAGFRRAGSP